ncbi:MAG: indolepyruvate oxidoreductase subunit beta family protein [Caldilineales bacterium]|nr:indolepyruvate oxidoreductase subunit beta family protein [Caldilineales bacterium]
MDRPISLLLAALGGQGGGVLTAWLMEAARLAGYPAQSTSIPGVAQRTGATTYYFELFPDPNPPGRPIFSLFPSASEVDVVAALEPTEAGRALQEGYVTAATTVVTSTQRVYSVAEKVVAGDGRLPAAPVVQALAQAAGRLVQVQLPPNGQANAYFFGALIGSRALPFSPADGRGAIENLGLAVAVNLAGFEAGVAAASHQAAPAAPELPPAGQVSPIFLTEETAPVEMPAPPGFEPELAALPAALRGLVGHGLARLVDYQDAAYARRFLARLGPILAADEAHPGHRLSAEVARRLAAWMSHEDIARVAQLKTRRERLARIRQEVGARAGEPVQVTDFLSPGWEEVGGVLPAGLYTFLGRLLGQKGRAAFDGHLRWPTSSPWGFAAMKGLAGLRRLRPRTLAFAQEQAAIETWLQAVAAAAAVDYDLACQTAELAVWARGYGDVRARGRDCLARVFADWPQKLHTDPQAAAAAVRASLHAARHEPDRACGQ